MKSLLHILMFCMLSVMTSAGMAESGSGPASATRLSANMAGVFVYRNTGVMGKALVEQVWLDGQLLGDLPNGSYFYLELKPGAHVLSSRATGGENDLHFEVTAGRNHYFSQVFVRKVPVVGALPLVGSVVGAFASNAKFVEAGDEDGVANLADCKQLAVRNLAVTGISQPDCMLALESDPALKPISKKVALSGKEDNLFSLMTIEELPGKSERKLIVQWGAKREACFNANPPARDAYYQISVDAFNRGQQLILELSKGQMSYGQFAERRRAIKQESLAQVQALNGK